MKQENLNALSEFDPTRGIYLVIKGKGEDQHIEAKEYKALKIPFLGRLLRRIVYPSFRFKKVIAYLLEQEADLQGLEDKRKLFLQEKIKDYFQLNVDGHASRHLKLWERVSQSYEKVFDIDRTETVEQHPVAEQQPITRNTSNYQLTGEAGEPSTDKINEERLYLYELPDSILSQLPPEENYIILPGGRGGRPANIWAKEEYLEEFKNYLRTKTNPILLFILYPGDKRGPSEFANSGPKEWFDAFKKEGLIKDYCPLYRQLRIEQFEGPLAGYEKKTKEPNKMFIETLKERLSSEEGPEYEEPNTFDFF
jgi:hypothetical protein